MDKNRDKLEINVWNEKANLDLVKEKEKLIFKFLKKRDDFNKTLIFTTGIVIPITEEL